MCNLYELIFSIPSTSFLAKIVLSWFAYFRAGCLSGFLVEANACLERRLIARRQS